MKILKIKKTMHDEVKSIRIHLKNPTSKDVAEVIKELVRIKSDILLDEFDEEVHQRGDSNAQSF